MSDMKHGLTTARPKLTILGKRAQVYMARAMEFGADKYARGNYHGPPPEGVTPTERYLGYLDAALRHITEIAQAITMVMGQEPEFEVGPGACGIVDAVSSGKFPASQLPHIAHALASLMIAVEVGVNDGLLPEDPGQPWASDPMMAEVNKRRDIPQKDDPDSEHRRIMSPSVVKKPKRR